MEMLEKKYIVQSASPAAVSIFLIEKKDGGPCTHVLTIYE